MLRSGMVALVLLMLVGGCAAEAHPPGTPQQLVARFRHDLGVTLVRRNSPTLRGFPSAVALDPTSEATARYGEFAVLVFDSAHDARLFVHGHPDRHGVHWTEVANELSNDPPYWSAAKLYGRVLLRWWTSQRRIDENWRRLDATVRAALNARN